MKISQLKRRDIRKTIQIETEDGMETVNIFNPTEEKSEELFALLQNSIKISEDGKESIDVQEAEVVCAVYKALTDIEFNSVEDLIEAVNDPGYELSLIANEIQTVVNEIARVGIRKRFTVIENLETTLLAGQAMGKANKVAQTLEVV